MKFMRQVGLIFSLFFWATSASAVVIQDVITGADMGGMNVTAFFNGGSESAPWEVTDTNAAVPEGEGLAGAATRAGWSLGQRGFTQGGNSELPIGDPTGNPIGVWTFTNNTGFSITSLEIDALAGNIVFDKFLLEVYTPDSNFGRTFGTATPGAVSSANYSDPFSNIDLFGTLTIEFSGLGLADDGELLFQADTDALVPVPAAAWLFGSALLSLVGLRRRQASAINQESGYTA